MEEGQVLFTVLPVASSRHSAHVHHSAGSGGGRHQHHYYGFPHHPHHHPHLHHHGHHHPHHGHHHLHQLHHLSTTAGGGTMPVSPAPPALLHQHSAQHPGMPRQTTSTPPDTLLEQHQNEPRGTHISSLYPEILALIFSYLDVRGKGRAAQVCTAWRDAAYHRSVWRGVEARLHLRRPNGGAAASGPSNVHLFSSLARRGIRKVQVLSLRRGLRDVVTGLPGLTSLSLSGCYNLTDLGLAHALCAAPLPSLTYLDLSLCKQITDESLARIASHLPRLEELRLGGCGHVTSAGLLLLALGLRKLRRLDLRSCWHVSDQGIAYLAGVAEEQRGSTPPPAIEDAAARVGAEGAAGAQAMALADPPGLSLEHLGLQDCQRLTDEALRHLSAGLGHSLRSLNLSFCVSVTDAGLRHLARMPALRELNLRACDNVTDAGMAFLAEGCGGLPATPNPGLPAMPSSSAPVSSSGSCSPLTHLDVSFCEKIGDAGLGHVSRGLFALRSLSLGACGRVTDEGLARVAETLTELETLNVGQCSRITDRGLAAVASRLTRLKCIDLYGCTRITPSGLQRVMTLPKLSVLNLGLWHIR
ncbi:F-box/LRR-repeat protein 14-like [Hetaerina americana]|uniref:F-box/LRR-repeat protein 14-like n=1 Tax=Hetaerina americana TaxID=62018 RepID=UPI003A7F3E92